MEVKKKRKAPQNTTPPVADLPFDEVIKAIMKVPPKHKTSKPKGKKKTGD